MRIYILGAGAMGSLFGGLLSEAGQQVMLLDINAAHIKEVSEHGLRLVTEQGDRRIQLPILRPEDTEEAPDWLIVFTKTLHTLAAMDSVRHLIGPDTRLLSLQNGLGNAEKLASFAPGERIAVGVTTVPADLVGPGHVESHGKGYIRLQGATGERNPSLDELSAALCAAGLDCCVDSNVHAAIWEKVAFNAALNSLCAVTKCTVGQLGESADSRALAHAIAAEVLETARARGLEVSDSVHATLDHAMDHHLHHKPSMLQDLLAGRPTEIDAINQAVVREAAKCGRTVPLTAALGTLVRVCERTKPAP